MVSYFILYNLLKRYKEYAMEIIKITEDNIDKEHICCVITEKKGESCIKSKKDWLKERIKRWINF